MVFLSWNNYPSKQRVYLVASNSYYRKVIVSGSGYIAVELAGILNALGSNVTIVIRRGKVRNFSHSKSNFITNYILYIYFNDISLPR